MTNQNDKVKRVGIGLLIRKYRMRQGLSQRQLEEKTGINRSTIAQIEKGGFRPSNENLLKFSAALNVNLSSLVDMEQSTTEQQEKDIDNVVSRLNLLAHRDYALARDFVICAEQAEYVKEVGDQFMFDTVEKRRRDVFSLYPGIATGTINLREFSTIELWGALIRQAEKSARATSSLDPHLWWLSPNGKIYHEMNLHKMRGNKKFRMERIFIFAEPDECRELREIILEQLSVKIKIWLAFNLPPGLATDFYVIDDNRYTGWLDVHSRNLILNTRFSTDPYETSRANNLFETLKHMHMCEEITTEQELDEYIEKCEIKSKRKSK